MTLLRISGQLKWHAKTHPMGPQLPILLRLGVHLRLLGEGPPHILGS